MSLEQRRALVTGGGRGIGFEIARALAGAGAQVILAGRRRESVEAAAAAIGAEPMVADLEAEGARGAEELAAACLRGGSVDILVNNAGAAEGAPLSRTDDAMWERTMALNATAPFRLCRALIPDMAKAGWGRVINIASTAGLSGVGYTSAYCASKHAVVGLTRALAAELGDSGVTVNALCPGWVETDMARGAIAQIAEKTGRSSDKARAGLERQSAQRRLLQPEEVAHAAVMLCADEARGIHGESLVIDGGGLLR